MDEATMARIGVVLGTRPELIKLAPVVSALRRNPYFEPLVIRTGQHADLFVQTMDDLHFSVDIELSYRSHEPVLSQAGSMLSQISRTLDTSEFYAVLVQGDITTRENRLEDFCRL